MAKKFSINGRDTRRGAFTDAEVIRPDGSAYHPDDTEVSGSGRHWTSTWVDVRDCLILVVDFTNSGKDQSYYELPEKTTKAQEEVLIRFCEEHGLKLPK